MCREIAIIPPELFLKSYVQNCRKNLNPLLKSILHPLIQHEKVQRTVL